MKFHHLTIRTRDLSSTTRFFEDVFDLEDGARPAVLKRIPGHWLYANARPVVHLIESRRVVTAGGYAGDGEEAIDHIGLRPEGTYARFKARLQRLNVRFSEMDVAELSERRMFFAAPGGQLLEAVFHAATASGAPD